MGVVNFFLFEFICVDIEIYFCEIIVKGFFCKFFFKKKIVLLWLNIWVLVKVKGCLILKKKYLIFMYDILLEEKRLRGL